MRRAVIIGASSGMGYAVSEKWLKAGNQALLVGRNTNALQQARKKLLDKGIPNAAIELQECDASQENAVQKLFSSYKEPLDLLVNAAGARFMGGLQSSESKSFLAAYESNFMVALLPTKMALPALKKSAQAGRNPAVVNIASAVAVKVVPGMLAYACAKAALIHFTKSVALELAPDQIRVNCLAPAAVDTPMLRGGSSDLSFAQFKEDLDKNHPLGRIGTAEEVAQAILWLGSGDNPWMTGAVLHYDGGYQLN